MFRPLAWTFVVTLGLCAVTAIDGGAALYAAMFLLGVVVVSILGAVVHEMRKKNRG